MEEVTITCTTFAYGGQTLGRLPDGRAVFVPFALPGERVRVTKTKAGYAEAELLEVIEPAPARISPRCRHSTRCGGCHYQHLPYAQQLAAKSQILRDQLLRLGGLVDPPLAPIVPSPQPWHYRNHMQFHRTVDGRLGLQAATTSTCFLVWRRACYSASKSQ
jgi:23S rRNA (uracil1939-C5)-methyltransferase